MTDTAAILTLKKPVSTLKKPIEFNSKSFFINATKAIAKGITLDISGASESALDILADAGLRNKPSEVAWVLIYQSLMLAVAELVQDSNDLFKTPPSDGQKGALGKQLETLLSKLAFDIDADFFKRPQDFSLLDSFRPHLKTWLVSCSLDEAQAEMTSQRLGAKFPLMLHNQWLAKPDEYACIKTALDTPFTNATLTQRRWLQYNAWLSEQVNQRLFHEAFSLKQVYVNPRAYYSETIKQDCDQEEIAHLRGEGKANRIVVDLHKELIHWAQNFDAKDAFRVISGGPGSGKSSLSKMLAAELITQCGFPVLFIPLHLFDPTADLVKAVENFVSAQRYLTGSPLDVTHGEQRLLIIFDGLDELAEQGKNAAEIAQSFVDIVIRDINHHNAQNLQRQVLITGRDLAVQSSLNRFRGSHQVYQLLPYYVSGYVKEQMVDKEQLLDTDLRDKWWQRYGQANGKAYSAMPEQLKTKQLEEITSQPLLNYLVALSFERGELDFAAQTTLNRIYQDLLTAVFERQYEQGRVHKGTGNLTQDQFFRILEEIALAIWHGDGRTTTIDYIEKRCEKSKLTRDLQAFEQSAAQGVTRLLTAFYFRQCDGLQQGEKTFEFTHKSFGEYLTARRLVRMLTRVSKMLARQDDDPEEGWDEKDALAYWAEFCGPTTMDKYLFKFVQDEVALKSPEQWAQWQACICRLIESALKHGMPMEKLGLKSFGQMLAQSRNAEECLLVMLTACSQQTKVVSEIKWPSNTAFGEWVKRLQGQRNYSTNKLVLSCLSYLDLSDCVLYFQDFYCAVFNHSNISGTLLVSTMFLSVDLSDADLSGAFLNDVNLHDADLTNANLTGVNLTGANLTDAILTAANLNRADLNRADLKNANLTVANLTEANLTRADLSGADLSGADLSGADLSGADLTDANLTDANLTDVNLIGVIYNKGQLSEEQLDQIRNE
ncbi:MAG: pentapeptide repeat-containing protein [Algicola sp.]|nr:pentapeptide repeat-containing protein [Algicola sp.]